MLTILCLVGMLPVLVLGISLGINSYRTVLKYREKDMTNTLQQACGIVDYQMYACQQMMNYFVYNQDVINFLECDPTKKTQRYELYQEVSNTIGALKYQNLIMESVTIYSEGIRQSFGNETHPLKDLYKESWYRDGIRDKEWVFDENTLDLISIYKIPSYSGIESYVAVRTDIPTLFESLNQLAVEQYGVHVQTQNDEIWNFSGKKCTDKNGIYVSFRENKKDYLWVQQDLNQMDATVTYFQKKSNISPFSGRAFLMIAVQVGACLICIILLGRRFAKYLSRPLEELTEEIQSMDEMNIQATVHSNREDEMGILINSYNHMMQRIQELIRENYETQIARKEFEMKALQAQINPHFLYNSLSMINWKAIEAGEEEISQVTLALSAFYRTTLNKGRTWISLRLAHFNVTITADPKCGFWGMVILTNWQLIGYMMIIYIAGIQNIPTELIEAAEIDGANKFQTLYKIIIPMTMPSVTICLFLTLTNCFKLFDQNLALTAGGPAKKTAMLAYDIYTTFYNRNGWEGVGQAKAVIFFIIVAAISLTQLYFTRRKEVEN